MSKRALFQASLAPLPKFNIKTRSVCDSPLPKDARVDTHGSAFFNRTSIGTVESFHYSFAVTESRRIFIEATGFMTTMKVKRETGENVLMLTNIEAKILFEDILHYIWNSVCDKKDFECNLHVCGGKGRDIRAQFNLKNSFDFDIVCIDKEQGTQYVTLTMKELEHLTNKLRTILNLYYV